ncbi:MAG: plasmid pRiA4b ORF-3 family protein [Thermodesulfobacteriota bacterium]
MNVRLRDIEPVIWRRFVVPAGISLDRFHDVLQIVMGWADSHLHEFTIGKKRYTEYPESREDGRECGRYRLGDLIKQKGRTMQYLYDFGDGWQHELTLEENSYFDPGGQYHIACLDGARACPPEDVGGVAGYEEFCRVMKDPHDEEYERFREWIGGDYDAERFDIDAVNGELAKYLRWSRDRLLRWAG